jgi:hypothetical protein
MEKRGGFGTAGGALCRDANREIGVPGNKIKCNPG